MSINHFSSDIPETLWWTQQQQSILMENSSTSGSGPPVNPFWPSQLYHHPPTPSIYTTAPRFNLNQDEEEEDDDDVQPPLNDQATGCSRSGEEEDEKEPMFEKPLTPSDVGKLNRLVIPKQHAEKYFPLGAGGDSGENKGLLLSFEDESGKCWRFRYSYWNSSQSYVLTKGWSRYVKDKRLDAGDVVLFQRHRADAQRFYINWRRRQQHSGSSLAQVSRANNSNSNNSKGFGGGGAGVGWTTRGFYSAYPYPTHQPWPYQPESLHAGREPEAQTQTTPVGNNSKVLRLFGVNMECQPEPDESGVSRPECPYTSSSNQGTSTHHHFYQYHHQPSHTSNPPHLHMDVNHMRNRPA